MRMRDYNWGKKSTDYYFPEDIAVETQPNSFLLLNTP